MLERDARLKKVEAFKKPAKIQTWPTVRQVAMVLCQETGETVRILQLAKRLSQYETSITVWRSVAGVLHQIRTLTW